MVAGILRGVCSLACKLKGKRRYKGEFLMSGVGRDWRD